MKILSAFLGAALVVVGITIVSAATIFTFDGAPSTPLTYSSPNLDVTYSLVGHNDEPFLSTTPITEDPEHGPNCEPPNANATMRHVATTPDALVFQCANHIMTYGPSGTSAVRLQPDKLLDLSGGSGVVRFDVSTRTLSSRDWLFLAVQNFDVAESKITNFKVPSAQGDPRNAIIIEQGDCSQFSSEQGVWAIKSYDSARQRVCLMPQGDIDSVLTRSATVRTKFEAQINKNGHVKFWLPDLNLVLAEGNVQPFTWNIGVVTFVHNTYSPDKGTNPLTGGLPGLPNTWHWDNFEVSPEISQTIVKTTPRAGDEFTEYTFSQPLPAGAVVRFEAFGDSAQVSFDGQPAVSATLMSAHTHPENAASYSVPGVTGATRVLVHTSPAWGSISTSGNVRAFKAGASTPPPPPSTPTPPLDVCRDAYFRNGTLTQGATITCP